MANECDACGASVAVGARFCGECGAIVRQKTRELDGRGGRSVRTTQPLKPKPNDSKRLPAKTQPIPGGKPAQTRTPAPTQRGPALDSLRATVRGIPTGDSAPPPSPSAPPPNAAPKTEPPSAPAPASPMLVSPPRASGAATTTPSTPPIPKPPPSSQPRTEFQRLLDEVETGFDAILEPEKPATIAPPADDPPGPPTTESEFDESQAKQLFFELVVANARPIRDFMIEVRLGEPHAAWVDFCGPAVKAILGSAEGMGYADLAVKLRGFIAVLDTLKTDPTRVIRGEARERVIDTYGELIVFLPEAFGVEAEANAREAVIVRSILSRVPGLYKTGLDRVYATGLVSLGLFYVSRPEDIAALSGLDLDLAERIAGRFRDYRKMVTELSPARGRSEERSRLRDASEAMLRASEAYDAARPATVEKRTLRRNRLDAMAEVALWLARLGEIDRLASISTMPFAARARDVLTFLSDVDKRAEAVHRAS